MRAYVCHKKYPLKTWPVRWSIPHLTRSYPIPIHPPNYSTTVLHPSDALRRGACKQRFPYPIQPNSLIAFEHLSQWQSVVRHGMSWHVIIVIKLKINSNKNLWRQPFKYRHFPTVEDHSGTVGHSIGWALDPSVVVAYKNPRLAPEMRSVSTEVNKLASLAPTPMKIGQVSHIFTWIWFYLCLGVQWTIDICHIFLKVLEENFLRWSLLPWCKSSDWHTWGPIDL